MRELEQGAAVGPQLYALLRDRIVQGELVPGARLSETELAAAYKVSRQPVREAFIKLAREELVAVRPQRGTFVMPISIEAVLTARFIREAVESDIVRSIVDVADEKAIAALDAQLELQRALRPDAPAQDFMALDEEFHRTLTVIAGQSAVGDYLEELKTQMNRVRHISAGQFSRDRLIAQHTAIVEALRARDSKAAEAGMRLHLRGILDDLPEVVRAVPQFFKGAVLDKQV